MNLISPKSILLALTLMYTFISPSHAHGKYKRKCQYILNNRTRSTVLASFNVYASQVAALPDVRQGSEPIMMLHPAQTCVQGTVVLFHGFSGTAAWSRQQADYMFSRGFNVYAVNLPGFAQDPKHWIRFRLRNSKGYFAARKALLANKRILRAITLSSGPNGGNYSYITEQLGGKIMPIVRAILSRGNAATKRALEGVKVMAPPSVFQNPGHAKEMNDYFVSDVMRYQSEGLARLAEVQPLPGPLFTLSFAIGSIPALNAIAATGAVKRAVMMSPFFPPENEDALTFQHVAGALGLFNRFYIGPRIVPLSPITAAYAAAAEAIREFQTMQIRQSTQSLCILVKDNVVTDFTTVSRVCQSKLGSKVFAYPPGLGIGHQLTPEAGNPYSDAMMEQIANFFLNGNIDETRFLEKNKE